MILRTRFNAGNYVPVIPNEDMDGGRLVKLAAGGDGVHGRPRVEYTDARTDYVYGALEYDAKAQDDNDATAPGKNVSVNRRPTLMTLIAGTGGVTENGRIAPGATGTVVAATDAAGENVVGRSLHAAAAGAPVLCVVNFLIK